MEKKKIERARISTIEVEELACYLTKLDYDEIDANEVIIDENLQEVYGTTLDEFTDLISALLPLIDVGSSPLTNERYKGFADKLKQMWYVKIKVKSDSTQQPPIPVNK